MIKKKKIDESLSLSGGIRNIILCFMCFRNHGQQFSEGEMRMKKGMLKGQRRELLFTVIFIMILTVSLNMIAFIWFQLRVYHMTFQQEFVDMKHYSLDRIHPSEMVKAGYICEEGLTQYEKLYFSIM